MSNLRRDLAAVTVRRLSPHLRFALALAFPAGASAWPTWGNVEKGDCAFAAVANWELVQTHWAFPRHPTEAEVIQDYEEARVALRPSARPRSRPAISGPTSARSSRGRWSRR